MISRRMTMLAAAHTVVTLAVLTLAAGALAGEYSRDFTLDGDRLLVGNMIGHVTVRAADGDDFLVTVHVRGEDAEEGLLEILETDDEGGALIVKFPIDKHDDYVYPELGRNSRSSINYRGNGDHGGSWLRKVFSGMTGERIDVRGRGNGLEVWADIEIAVPAKARLKVRHGVGRIDAADVRADLDLDTHSGAITAEAIDGDLRADTGSGRVEARGIEGDVNVDTGSGSVLVADCKGNEILVDTGSGSVDAENLRCEKLLIDTGSGGVEARSVSADDAKIDTGSGSVRLELDHMGHGDFVIDTGSGSIDLIVPDDASARIVADTGSGRVRNQLDEARVERMERDEMRLVVGGGSAKVTLDAGSGSITVSRK